MKITPLQISDFLKFSVHYLCCHIQPITVVTYYVAILSKIECILVQYYLSGGHFERFDRLQVKT